ncbi:hypothetical protein NTGM5_10017 [Candidatus Nitrotoga sp. M5]|nr:hypothetical protein NTGM5_10017 [Candidatus Nitrotoga sp. M5]
MPALRNCAIMHVLIDVEEGVLDMCIKVSDASLVYADPFDVFDRATNVALLAAFIYPFLVCCV